MCPREIGAPVLVECGFDLLLRIHGTSSVEGIEAAEPFAGNDFGLEVIARGSRHHDVTLICRISSASIHKARLRLTFRSMLPTGRVCSLRPFTLRPGCPPSITLAWTR